MLAIVRQKFAIKLTNHNPFRQFAKLWNVVICNIFGFLLYKSHYISLSHKSGKNVAGLLSRKITECAYSDLQE